MPVQLTSTARRQGLKNALICGIGLLVLWLAVTVALSLLPGRKLLDSMMLSFALLWVVTFLAFLGTWLYGLSTRGRVLLDCGPPAHRRNYFMIAVLSLVGAAVGSLAATPASPPLMVASPVFAVSFAAYWFIAATGRLQVRENGLWFYCNLLRWRKIKHYRWAPDSTLMLTATLPFWCRGAVPIPPEQREDFDALLTQHWSPTREKLPRQEKATGVFFRAGLSPSIPVRSKRLQLGFPGAERYPRARRARRSSRAKVKWGMSD